MSEPSSCAVKVAPPKRLPMTGLPATLRRGTYVTSRGTLGPNVSGSANRSGGAHYGEAGIPAGWRSRLALLGTIEDLADRLHDAARG